LALAAYMDGLGLERQCTNLARTFDSGP